jgi:isopentenyl-diphosphate delta-isomerase
MTSEMVVLVDPYDAPVGTQEKLAAHEQGQLHRAFSVFVFDGAGRMLLQRRAEGKYHSAGLWSNTCCGHPRPGEETAAGARRRLREEMGLDCALEPAFTFLYRASVGGGLTEHEFDHVFTARCEDPPRPDPAEVGEWRWIAPADLSTEMEAFPERFTFWFREVFQMAMDHGIADQAERDGPGPTGRESAGVAPDSLPRTSAAHASAESVG